MQNYKKKLKMNYAHYFHLSAIYDCIRGIFSLTTVTHFREHNQKELILRNDFNTSKNLSKYSRYNLRWFPYHGQFGHGVMYLHLLNDIIIGSHNHK